MSSDIQMCPRCEMPMIDEKSFHRCPVCGAKMITPDQSPTPEDLIEAVKPTVPRKRSLKLGAKNVPETLAEKAEPEEE